MWCAYAGLVFDYVVGVGFDVDVVSCVGFVYGYEFGDGLLLYGVVYDVLYELVYGWFCHCVFHLLIILWYVLSVKVQVV